MNCEVSKEAIALEAALYAEQGMETWRSLRRKIIDRYLQQAREESVKSFVRDHCPQQDIDLLDEINSLKASNNELRNQLAGITKHNSELQHCLRLAQDETARKAAEVWSGEHLKECATKAANALFHGGLLVPAAIGKVTNTDHNFFKALEIICEAFGLPKRDECVEAFLKWWRPTFAPDKTDAESDAAELGFCTAWKLKEGK